MGDSIQVRVAAAVIERDGSYLLSKRLPHGHGANMWEFPGGKVEAGETLARALVRELEEELGIVVSPGDLVTVIRHRYPERTVELNFLRASIVEGEPRTIEVAEFGWFRPSEMMALPLLAADEPLVKLLVDAPAEGQGRSG